MEYEEVKYNTGEIVRVDLGIMTGHQQSGIRLAIIVSNNVGNKYSPTIEILPATSKRNSSNQPTHAKFKANEIDGLTKDTVFEAEQKMPINKFQVIEKVGQANDKQLERVAMAMVFATPIVYKAFEKGIGNNSLFQKISTAKNY